METMGIGVETSAECTLAVNGELLKKALLQFSKRYQHHFSRAVRLDLRRILYFAASFKGRYLKHMFQDADESTLPQNWPHVLMPERFQHLENPDIYFERGHIHDPAHPNRSCGRKFKKGEPIYRCMTCSKDESSGLCVECFSEENHKDHDVIPLICQRENGGVCDCGDEDAWQLEFRCNLLDVKETPMDDVPQELKEALGQTFEIILDFVVDVMTGSTPILNLSKTVDAESVLLNTHQSTFEQGKYLGTDWPSEEFCLMIYNDQNRQYRDAVHKIKTSTGKLMDFALMVADEVNVAGRAKVMCHSNLDELIQSRNDLQAAGLPCCIRNARDVFREEICAEMIEWLVEMMDGPVYGNYNVAADYLSRAFCRKWDVGVKPRLSDEQFAGGLLAYTDIPNIKRHSHRDTERVTPDHWKHERRPWKTNQSIADDCQYDLNFSACDADIFHGSRLQYLLYFDIRFWKAPRINLHNLVNSVLASNRTYRPIVCFQYVDIYPKLLEMFFHHDREPEYSCMTSLTTQVFTSSSNANSIAEHGDLSRLLASAYGYLTTLDLVRADDVIIPSTLLLQSFKNRRIGQVFFDICCVLTKSSYLENTANEQFVNQVCDVLLLFQGKPTLKREALDHVEYESSDYGLYFNMYSVVTSLSEMVAKLFLELDTRATLPLIELIFKRIVQAGNMRYKREDEEITDVSELRTIVVDTVEGPFLVDNYKPHTSPVSFLHPLHAFVTWGLQYSRLTDIHDIKPYVDLFGNDVLFVLLEYPLRTLVLLSQIRVGMWVRNGFSIKTQHNIYRTSGIRESGFKRDVYLIQLLMCIVPGSQIMASFINKWSLQSWLNEDFTNYQDYDQATLPLIVEEFLLLTIQLLCDTPYLFDSDRLAENRIRRELIHSLCFETMPYSKICASIPDYMCHEKRFDLILNKISTYIPPSGPNSIGLYKLRDECLDEVDPYYIHYNANNREDAEKLLKTKISKAKGIPLEEAYIEPKLIRLDGTLFQNLFSITSSKIFVQFLRSTLKFVNERGLSVAETLMNVSLHLIHVGVTGLDLSNSTTFGETIWSELRADHNEPFYYESVGALLYKFLREEPYKAHHSKIRAIFQALKAKNIRYDEYLHEQVSSYDPAFLDAGLTSLATGGETEFDKKKRSAKERRAKLMAKFKKQQNKFVEQHQTAEDPSDVDMVDSDSEDHWSYPEEHCILCQMTLTDSGFFGVVCNMSQSAVGRRVPFDNHYWTMRAFDDFKDMDQEGTTTYLDQDDNHKRLNDYFSGVKERLVIGPAFPVSDPKCLKTSLMANSCGHGMHYSCYQQYLHSAISRQTQITRTVPEDFENNEFICPLCKSLGNVFVPILWSRNRNKFAEFIDVGTEDWYSGFEALKGISCSEPEIIAGFTVKLVEELRVSLKPNYQEMICDRGKAPNGLFQILTDFNSKLDQVSQPHFKDHLLRLVAESIKTTELSLRGTSCDSGLITDLISNQNLTTLRILVEFKKTMISSTANTELKTTIRRKDGFNVKILEEALGRLAFLSSDRLFEIFDSVDFFDFIVQCLPYENISYRSIYQMGLICTILQSLASLMEHLKNSHFEDETASLWDITMTIGSNDSYSAILSMANELRNNHPLFDNLSDEIFNNDGLGPVLYTLLVRSITSYLRNVALWSIANCGDYKPSLDCVVEEELECNKLCSLLNMPTIDDILSLMATGRGVEGERFKSFVGFVSTTDNELRFRAVDYPAPVRLLDLPTRLDDVFTKLIYRDTPSISLATFDPAICLFCGSMLNLQKKASGTTTTDGECNNHVNKECLNHCGMFLLPRHSAILLLNKGNGSFHPAPYIDAHGEFHSEVRHNQIMTLSDAKYDLFTKHMWIQQDTKNYVTRKLEGTLDIGGWESL